MIDPATFDRLITDMLAALKPVFDQARQQGLHNEAIPAIAMALAAKAGELLVVIPDDDRRQAVERACEHLMDGAFPPPPN